MFNVPKTDNGCWCFIIHFYSKCVIWVRMDRPAKLPSPTGLESATCRPFWRSNDCRHTLVRTKSLYKKNQTYINGETYSAKSRFYHSFKSGNFQGDSQGSRFVGLIVRGYSNTSGYSCSHGCVSGSNVSFQNGSYDDSPTSFI